VHQLLIGQNTPETLVEDYRRLRTSLLSMAELTPRKLLVTSSTTGEGTTTTVVNIAASLAQTGSKVLIVDGNLRNPAVHSIFHIDSQRGLSGVLSGQGEVDQVFASIEQDVERGIALLPAGPVPKGLPAGSHNDHHRW